LEEREREFPIATVRSVKTHVGENILFSISAEIEALK
jgi:hypothetical protein